MPDHPDAPPGFEALAAAAARDPRGGDALVDLARAALREGRREEALRTLAGLVTRRSDEDTVRGFLAGMRLLEHCIGDPRFDLEGAVRGLRATADGSRLEVGLLGQRQVFDPATWWSHLEDGPLPTEAGSRRRDGLILEDLQPRGTTGSRRVVDVGDVRVVAEEERLRVVTRDKGRPLLMGTGCRRAVVGLVGSPDGRLALTVDADGEVVAWDTASGLPRWRRAGRELLPHARRRVRPSFAPDGRLMVWVPTGGAWVDPETGVATPLPEPLAGAPWGAAAPGPAGSGWVCAAGDELIHMSEEGTPTRVPTPAPEALAFLPGGSQIVAASQRHLRVLERPLLEEVLARGWPRAAAWARFGTRLAWVPGRGLLARYPSHRPLWVTGGSAPGTAEAQDSWARHLGGAARGQPRDFAFTADRRHLLLARGHHLRMVPVEPHPSPRPPGDE